MSIFWSIYFVDDNDLDRLNLLLVGMIVSKIGSLFASQVVLKFVLFRYKKWSYFKKCKEKANQQKLEHDKCLKNNKFSDYHKYNVEKA